MRFNAANLFRGGYRVLVLENNDVFVNRPYALATVPATKLIERMEELGDQASGVENY